MENIVLFEKQINRACLLRVRSGMLSSPFSNSDVQPGYGSSIKKQSDGSSDVVLSVADS